MSKSVATDDCRKCIICAANNVSVTVNFPNEGTFILAAAAGAVQHVLTHRLSPFKIVSEEHPGWS